MSVNFSISRRRAAVFALAAPIALLFSGCSRQAADKTYEMGEEIAVGSLVYVVTQTAWQEQLDGEHGARVPAQKFFLVNVTVRNAGRESAGVPLLSILNAAGQETMELDKGEGAPQWLGALRNLPPGETVSGNLLYDVAPGAYKLRVSSGGDVEKEATALVNLPYSVDAGRTAPAETLPSPAPK